ncbi:glycoside hydrolase family 28 protein [Agrilactobacillus yilanensis]|uniref:Glycoside hydrolase family 28 protein n=1 Tax=Agrilactobacillus yilanensis TaxID=2485997 RepID=A0ABW4J4K3_9LACO|nr:glycosyl hydrolase family 28 protein [Agrilactobacillus yilanensis]
MQIFNVLDYGALGDGQTLDTTAIQQAIDAAALVSGEVFLPAKTYLVGALFIKRHVTLSFQKGAKLLGSTDIADFPEIFSRVAGVEMCWPAAILNLLEVDNVTIKGQGIIDGQGPHWWQLYWGADGHGGQRQWYDTHDLRWIADYAIKRPRSILVFKSEAIIIKDITLQRAGFWNLQLTYATDVEVKDIIIRENNGPSTDGIDVDSSNHVHIHHCQLACGDDCIALKSGRDGDGYRVGIATSDVEIDHCQIKSGYGVTIGSEVSGNIHDITIHDMTFENSGCGFRMKSAVDRGGVIENIRVSDLQMTNVQFPFSWLMTWHNQYNHKTMVDLADKPAFWQAVAAQIPEAQRFTKVQNITVQNVTAQLAADYPLPARAFDLKALPEKPMEQIRFSNVKLAAKEFGNIVAVNDLQFKDVTVSVQHDNTLANDAYDNR